MLTLFYMSGNSTWFELFEKNQIGTFSSTKSRLTWPKQRSKMLDLQMMKMSYSWVSLTYDEQLSYLGQTFKIKASFLCPDLLKMQN